MEGARLDLPLGESAFFSVPIPERNLMLALN
jgi:hypothetical protein